VATAVASALDFTRQLQTRPKRYSEDLGGWRYIRLRWSTNNADSDLSVTGWQLMFLRAAKNAAFDVPEAFITDAMNYVQGCWDEQRGIFHYTMVQADKRASRGMTAVGILSFSLAGQHKSRIALRAGEWLLKHPVKHFSDGYGSGDRLFYTSYYSSQAMAQLGGHFWQGFYPSLVNTLLPNQTETGAWPPEPLHGDGVFGPCYSTALAVLALTPPFQVLPVYQR
jgi:hypothetical protein